jgi:rhodanese-related sulfurtransferase
MTRVLALAALVSLAWSPGGAAPAPAAAAAPAPAPATIADATLGETGHRAPEISTAELRAILRRRTALVFDARSPREFAMGHIPGALNVKGKPGLPPSQYVSDAGEVERAAGGDRATSIVLYCNGPYCGRSKRLADELIAAGFTHVSRYQLGMPVWRALGGVQQIEREGLRHVLANDKTAVFLDARGTASVPWARGLPLAEVRKAKDDGRLPMDDHHARIVVIGADGAQAGSVAAAVAEDAFDNVSFYAGDSAELGDAWDLVGKLDGVRVTLADGLAAAEARGLPISAKFELAEGQLQLSVYVTKPGGFAEVIVDHVTRAVVHEAAITEGEDLAAARAQAEVMGKAKRSLRAALAAVSAAQRGARAASIVPAADGDSPAAAITFIRGTDVHTVTQRLDR